MIVPAPAEDSGAPVLEVLGVSRAFGGVHAVDNVDLRVHGRQCVGLIGPNGAGKSTLLNVIAGAERPDHGAVFFEGRNVTRMAAYRRARLGLVRTFQLASEFPNLTVLENLVAAAPERVLNSLAAALLPPLWSAAEQRALDRAMELLEGIRLDDMADELAGTLSGGQRRLVEIVRALMAEPKMLLLDEPTAGVDPGRIREIEDYIKQVQTRGVTILMVEHQLEVVNRICDVVHVMAEGRVIASGTLDAVRQQEQVVEAYVGRA
jgi:ABC-type branched-subunit amino acid transport system ATPase component